MSRTAVLLTFLLLVGCKPERDLHDTATSAEASGDLDGALTAYRQLGATYPETPEGKSARGEVGRLLLLKAKATFPSDPAEALRLVAESYGEFEFDEHSGLPDELFGLYFFGVQRMVKGGDFEGAVRLMKVVEGGSALPPRFEAMPETLLFAQGEDRRLGSTYLWLDSAGADQAARAAQALALIGREPRFQAVIQPWLDANLLEAKRGDCLEPLEDLAAIGTVADLDALEEACMNLTSLLSSGPAVDAVNAALEGEVAKRRKALQSTPGYRTEAALQACREFQSWVRAQKRAGNITALQRGVEGSRGRKYEKAVDYLSRRLDGLSSLDAQYRLGRRIRAACGG